MPPLIAPTTAGGFPRITLRAGLPRLGATGLATGFIYLVFLFSGLMQFTDPDYWWHLRTGRLIVQTGAIPKHDPFTLASSHHVWVAHEWLSEVIIYALQLAGGYAANAIFFTLIALAALVLVHRVALSMGVPRWPALILFVWSAAISHPFWTVRPQAFTWLFFAMFLAILLKHERSNRRIWCLPLLILIWANLHLGHAMGLALVGLYLLTTTLESKIWGIDRDLRVPAMVFAACLAAVFANPNTFHQVAYPLQYLRPGNPNVAYISEWQSPNFHEAGNMAFLLAILALIGFGVFRQRGQIFLPTLAVAFACFGLQSVRQEPLFGIVFFFEMAALLAAPGPWHRLVAKIPVAEPSGRNAAILGLIVLLGAVLIWAAPGAQVHHTARVVGPLSYPEVGAKYIGQNYPEARIFNDAIWGGYLIDQLYPQPVFVDGRSDLHGARIYGQYITVLNATTGWQAVLDSYAIDLVIVQSNSRVALALQQSADWSRVLSRPLETIFVRRDGLAQSKATP